MRKNRNFAVTVVIFIIMAAIAVVDNTKGIFIPAFKESFNANNTSMGIMLSACSLGYIIFTYIGGILCEKLGQRKVILLGLTIIIGSTVIIASANIYLMLLVGMFLLNMGIAFGCIAINTLIPALFVAIQAIMMNIAHCSYGFGSTLGQFTIGKILDSGIGWRSVFYGIAVMFVIVVLVFLLVKMPTIENSCNEAEEKPNEKSVFKEKYVYIYALALGTYIFAEMGMSNWIVNFLMESYNFTSSTGATFLSVFFLLLTIGRLLGGFVAEKFGYLQSVMASMAIAIALLIIALVVGNKALVLICVTGLFFAITYPTVVATISKVFKENTSYITGVILTGASSISMILNLLMGRLNDVIGTTMTFYLIPTSLTVSMIFVVIIYRGKQAAFQRGGKNIG